MNFDKYLTQKNNLPPKPKDATMVRAEVTQIAKYEGGSTSADTWPHYFLTMKITSGVLPHHPSEKIFEYHTDDLRHVFKIGQSLTFVFDPNGKLWGVEEIQPAYPAYFKTAESVIKSTMQGISSPGSLSPEKLEKLRDR